MGEIAANAFGSGVEFIRFVLLADKGFYNPDSTEVFLNGAVKDIISFKNTFENRVRFSHDNIKSAGNKRKTKHKNHCKLRIDPESKNSGKNHHDGGTESHSYKHLVCHLDVLNVGGHSCNKA